jgi:hypothetical protein
MTESQLPPRPSLESLRKQAKKLARRLSLSQRDAQLVLAREYGFAGWQDLIKEVNQRLGRGLEWAVSEARRRIHDNDVDGLRQLLSEYPALLSWKADEADSGLLGMATGSYGDSDNPVSEEHFTRLACAELLLDAGAFIAPSVCDGLIQSRARKLIDLFHRRGLFPRSLKFFAALGDVAGVRASLDTHTDDPHAVNEAFMYGCHLQHETVAALLLDRAIALDPESGRRIDSGPGRSAFIEYFIENKPDVHDADPFRPWQAFVMRQIDRAMHDGDLTSFVEGLRRDSWLLSDAFMSFQSRLIAVAVLNDRGSLLNALFDLDPAILHAPVPPPSSVISWTFIYVKTHLLPLLLRIWPMPDDLPHAAGNGDLARLKRWFDASGKPALGNLTNHFPVNDAQYRRDLYAWFGREPNAQDVLDTALAWAVLNNHFEVADFLLAHGADINTNWCSHEPASILHELVWYKNYEAMQFLIDRGIDMTIRDFRWRATAQGWAFHAAHDEKLAQWLADAEKRREQASSPE